MYCYVNLLLISENFVEQNFLEQLPRLALYFHEKGLEQECSVLFAVYVNHRPAFGLSPFDLNEAFTKLGIPSDEGFAIDRDRLLTLLQNKGTTVNLFPQRRESSL